MPPLPDPTAAAAALAHEAPQVLGYVVHQTPVERDTGDKGDRGDKDDRFFF